MAHTSRMLGGRASGVEVIHAHRASPRFSAACDDVCHPCPLVGPVPLEGDDPELRGPSPMWTSWWMPLLQWEILLTIKFKCSVQSTRWWSELILEHLRRLLLLLRADSGFVYGCAPWIKWLPWHWVVWIHRRKTRVMTSYRSFCGVLAWVASRWDRLPLCLGAFAFGFFPAYVDHLMFAETEFRCVGDILYII